MKDVKSNILYNRIFKDLGIALYNSDGGFRCLQDIIEDLSEVFDKLDKEPQYYSNVELDNVMTLVEATEKWGLADSTLRKLMTTDKLVTGIDYKKSGRATLITKRAMTKIYGDMPIK